MAAKRVMTMLFYTKKSGCSLCVVAKKNIAAANVKLNDAIRIQDVDIEAPGNEEIYKQYRFDIPVGTVEGEEVFRHRLSPEKAEAIYEKWLQKQPKEDL